MLFERSKHPDFLMF